MLSSFAATWPPAVSARSWPIPASPCSAAARYRPNPSAFARPRAGRVRMARARAHPVISIQVVGEPQLAIDCLRNDPRVESVEPQNGELMVTLCDRTLHHHFLIERLIAHQIQIQAIAPHQLKLEDVFLRLTKGIVQ